MAGELYVVDIEAETLHSLNPAALLIWNCLEKGLDAEKTAVRLAAEFDVAPATAAADVKDFMKTLAAKGLIK